MTGVTNPALVAGQIKTAQPQGMVGGWTEHQPLTEVNVLT